MTIPESIKILGHTFKILPLEFIETDGGQLANVRVAEHVIRTARRVKCGDDESFDIPESRAAEAFLHEIIHAVLWQNGFGQQEKLTTSLACGLFAVIRDNDLDFREGKYDPQQEA